MLNAITVRFFTYANAIEQADVFEITERCFKELSQSQGACISYMRHSVYENGVSQVCLTVELPGWPDVDDIELEDN